MCAWRTSQNVAPSILDVTAPVDPMATGAGTNVSASFYDPGILDSHSALWAWGDGSVSPGVVTESNGSGSVSGSHVYAVPGVYTLKITVSDDDGGMDEATYEYVVVYDPSGGFVTGGGWIDSPAGAYPADPTLTGRATFGFVSKYLKGATVPSGETQFQFKAGDLSFHSSSYDWLVVAGAKAIYKGTGTINGEYGYGFMLTAVDGQITGGGGVDKLRMRIWENISDTVVYDNQLGDVEDADASTVLGGGSIVVHK